MSVISEALKTAKEPQLLLELDFGGLVLRYALRDIALSDRVFKAGLFKPLEIQSSFDFRSMSYTSRSISVELINKDRLQDYEMDHVLDGGIGRVYVWAPGLDWSDISTAGHIFSGAFHKASHTKETYSFRLDELWEANSRTIPKAVINADTWPNMRMEGGYGSVAGKPEPLIFGAWTKGIPLRCVDTAAYKYLAHMGVSKNIHTDYSGGTYDVFDKDGAVIDPAGYTFYPSGVDSQGNIVAYFDFTSDQAESEPLSCSIRGLYDGSGEITGTAGQLLEHPSEIISYLLSNHSGFGHANMNATLKTMKSLLPGMKFASLINNQARVEDIIRRISEQCLVSPITYGDAAGIVTLSTTVPTQRGLNLRTQAARKTARIARTPEDDVLNNIKVRYGLNPTTGQYEGEKTRNRLNDSLCALSYKDYGETPQKIIDCADVQDEATAMMIAARTVDLKAYRHDLVETEVPYWEGIDQREGDAAELTVEEGPSRDGAGWENENCILVERTFLQRTIRQTWWRISTV